MCNMTFRMKLSANKLQPIPKNWKKPKCQDKNWPQIALPSNMWCLCESRKFCLITIIDTQQSILESHKMYIEFTSSKHAMKFGRNRLLFFAPVGYVTDSLYPQLLPPLICFEKITLIRFLQLHTRLLEQKVIFTTTISWIDYLRSIAYIIFHMPFVAFVFVR